MRKRGGRREREKEKEADRQTVDGYATEGGARTETQRPERERQQQRRSGWETEAEMGGKSEPQNRRETGRGRGGRKNLRMNLIRSEGRRAKVSWVLLIVCMI